MTFAFASLASLGSEGCSLDWSVSPTPSDAANGDASAVDGGIDGEANVDADGAPDGDASLPSEDGAPQDCTGLTSDLDAKKKKARECKLSSGQCTETLKDQCDCDVFIATPGSAEAIAYATAVEALKSAACPLGCTGSCPAATNGICLVTGTASCTP